MNVGSIFELANRTGLWMFCGERSHAKERILPALRMQ